LADSQNYLKTVKQFMNDLSSIINNLTPGNSGLTQAAVTTDVATVNAALSAVNGAIDAVTASQTALANASAGLSQAESNYQLKLSGNSADSIAAQQAKVDGAKAALAEDTIIAPTDGLITVVTPTVGEFATPGTPLFGIQNNDGYEVDAYVAEADIAKVAIGDQSSTTLDAYGPDTNFEAKVTAIDPAETVLQGVPTYKVTLMFDQNDPRIRSGMTANLEILTHQADNVLSIPSRAVIDDNGSKTVRVVNADGKTYTTVPVTIGLKGSNGTTEITSGLTAGQTVVTYLGTGS
jgi:HlyD family secretion protein